MATLHMRKRYYIVIFNFLILWIPLVTKYFVAYNSITYRDICDLWLVIFVPLNLVSIGVFLYEIVKEEIGLGQKFLSGFLVVSLVSIYAVFNFFVVFMGMPQYWIAP